MSKCTITQDQSLTSATYPSIYILNCLMRHKTISVLSQRAQSHMHTLF